MAEAMRDEVAADDQKWLVARCSEAAGSSSSGVLVPPPLPPPPLLGATR